MTLKQKRKRRKQLKAAQQAIQQAQALNDAYSQAGMTPDQVNDVNSQVANIGGASKQMIRDAATPQSGGSGGGGGDSGGGDSGGYTPDGDDGYSDGDYFEYLENTKDPIFLMCNYNRMYGEGSGKGKFYNTKLDKAENFMNLTVKAAEGESFENAEFADWGLDNIADDIGGIVSQFRKNWESNKPEGWQAKHEDFFGIQKFFKNHAKKESDKMDEEGFDTSGIFHTIKEYLLPIVAGVAGWYMLGMGGYYKWAGWAAIAFAGYKIFTIHKADEGKGGATGKEKPKDQTKGGGA